MYNGIGLQTPRGSGTNGYVQRNLAFVKSKKDRVDYKTEEELNKLDQGLNKQPNREILDHERKRKVELKCMEMQELMEEQGYSDKEVTDKVNMFRKMLMAKEGVSESSTVDRDEHGRPIARETHQLAEANQEKNARLKEAFGLSDYVEGSAFDPERKAKEEAAKAAAAAQKKYNLVKSSDEEEGKEEASTPHKKKKKRSRHDSTSPDRSREKRKKSRKHSKRDRSHSKRHSKKSKHRSKRRYLDRKKRRRHHSSSSDSDSHDDGQDSDARASNKDKQDSPVVNPSGLHTSPSPSHVSTISKQDASLKFPSSVQNNTFLKSCSPVNVTSVVSSTGEDGLSTEPIEITPMANSSRSTNGRDFHSRSRSRSRSASHPSYRRSSSSLSSSSRSRSPSRTPAHSQSRTPRHRSHSNSRSRSHSVRRSHSSGSERRSSHRDSRSPSIRRRHGSPSHLDKRRITSARKRPVPYYRPSPSPSFSDSDSSYHSRRSRSRSHASRSRFRSLSRSPSLELYHRRRKHQQQHPVHHHQQNPQQLYQHIAQPLPPPPPSSSSSSLANPALSSVYPTTCLISQS